MNPDWFINYPYGPFLDDVDNIDEGFVDDSAASDTSSLPDLEDIFIPVPHNNEEDDERLGHVKNDGGDIIVIVIAICIVIVIGICIAFTMTHQKPSNLWVHLQTL